MYGQFVVQLFNGGDMKVLRYRETSEYPIYQDQVDHRIRSITSCQAEIPYGEFGYDEVFPAPAPAFDPITHYAREIDPVLTQLGTYQQAWEIVALDAETIAANQAAKKVQDIAATRSSAQQIILAKYPLWVQVNYSNGIYPATDADVMRAAIASVIAESNRLEDAITAGTPATPNWPVI